MKTNRQRNQAHDSRQTVRPKPKHYDFEALAQVVNQWVRSRHE